MIDDAQIESKSKSIGLLGEEGRRTADVMFYNFFWTTCSVM